MTINGAVTEWLRCTIRNRLGLSRVGSSPASIDTFFTLVVLLSGFVTITICYNINTFNVTFLFPYNLYMYSRQLEVGESLDLYGIFCHSRPPKA